MSTPALTANSTGNFAADNHVITADIQSSARHSLEHQRVAASLEQQVRQLSTRLSGSRLGFKQCASIVLHTLADGFWIRVRLILMPLNTPPGNLASSQIGHSQALSMLALAAQKALDSVGDDPCALP